MALDRLRGKWRIEILLSLLDGPVRLGQLRRRVPQATERMLVRRLREMEKEGIITRTDLSEKIKRVEYTLCDPAGVAVLDLLVSLAEWGTRHLPVVIVNDLAAPPPRPACGPFPVRRAEVQGKRESA
jgi:DNA-binding HxlR family transcriptional regulator